ncbi:MAG: PAS domain-containing sensor histidine kinase [Cyanobacteriota bacterium]
MSELRNKTHFPITQESHEFNIEANISRSLLNHLYEGIYFVDINRQIKFWNRGAENITGFSKEDVINKHCHDGILCHKNEQGEELCVASCPLVLAIENDCYIDERVYLQHKNGTMIPVWIHVSPIKSNEGKIIGAVEVFEDDSDYDQLKQANKKLEDLNELKNQFLGMAAHDLRNPLSVVMSFSSFLLDFNKQDLSDNQSIMIRKINNASKTMLLLINDLLDITSIESGKINLKVKKYNINEVINLDNYSMKLIANQKNIAIKVDIEPGIPDIELDLDRFNQVMENLISNAAKYSYPGTTITLHVAFVDNNLLISVIDQGQGMPHEELPKLFKPFQKTSIRPTAKESSTGLGLLIVKKIVEMHNGTITVQSEPGKGSTFTISIPVKTQI